MDVEYQPGMPAPADQFADNRNGPPRWRKPYPYGHGRHRAAYGSPVPERHLSDTDQIADTEAQGIVEFIITDRRRFHQVQFVIQPVQGDYRRHALQLFSAQPLLQPGQTLLPLCRRITVCYGVAGPEYGVGLTVVQFNSQDSVYPAPAGGRIMFARASPCNLTPVKHITGESVDHESVAR